VRHVSGNRTFQVRAIDDANYYIRLLEAKTYITPELTITNADMQTIHRFQPAAIGKDLIIHCKPHDVYTLYFKGEVWMVLSAYEWSMVVGGALLDFLNNNDLPPDDTPRKDRTPDYIRDSKYTR
jgi:hypothetical protein